MMVRGAIYICGHSILSGYRHRMLLQILFPGECLAFQGDNASAHAARYVQTWLDEYVDKVNISHVV